MDPDGEHYIGTLRKTSAPAMYLQVPRRHSLINKNVKEKLNLMTSKIAEESVLIKTKKEEGKLHTDSGRDI